MNGVLAADRTGCLAGKLAEDREKMITNGMASGSKLGIDATKKIPGEGFKRPWPPCGDEALGERRPTLIKMDATVKAKVEKLFGKVVSSKQ